MPCHKTPRNVGSKMAFLVCHSIMGSWQVACLAKRHPVIWSSDAYAVFLANPHNWGRSISGTSTRWMAMLVSTERDTITNATTTTTLKQIVRSMNLGCRFHENQAGTLHQGLHGNGDIHTMFVNKFPEQAGTLTRPSQAMHREEASIRKKQDVMETSRFHWIGCC